MSTPRFRRPPRVSDEPERPVSPLETAPAPLFDNELAQRWSSDAPANPWQQLPSPGVSPIDLTPLELNLLQPSELQPPSFERPRPSRRRPPFQRPPRAPAAAANPPAAAEPHAAPPAKAAKSDDKKVDAKKADEKKGDDKKDHKKDPKKGGDKKEQQGQKTGDGEGQAKGGGKAGNAGGAAQRVADAGKGKAGAADGKAADTQDGGGEDGGDAASGGGRATAERGEDALEPAPAPRFDNMSAVRVPMLPELSRERLEQVRVQTGMTLAEHYAKTQNMLDMLAARAQQEQRAMVFHIELTIGDVTRDLEGTAALIPEAVGRAIGGVKAAFDAARKEITHAVDDALLAIEGSASEADRKPNDAALSTKEALDNAILGSTPKLQALYEKTMAQVRAMLKATADRIQKIGDDQAAAMKKEGTRILGEEKTKATTEIAKAELERKEKLITKMADDGAADLTRATTQGVADILGEETQLGLTALMLLNPTAVEVVEGAQVCTQGVQAAKDREHLRLTNDYERAKKFITITQKRTVDQLDATEKSTVQQLWRMRAQLEKTARQRIARLRNAMEHGEAPAAEVWSRELARANHLVPAEGQIDYRRLEPRFFEVAQSFDALAARQRSEFDAQTDASHDDTRRGLDEDRHGLDEAAQSALQEAHKTKEPAAAIRQIGANFAAGFRGVAQPASSAMGDFAHEAEEKLGQPFKYVDGKMKELTGSAKTTLDEQVDKCDASYKKVVSELAGNLVTPMQDIDSELVTDLGRRAGEALRAMDRWGTDEHGLNRALAGMTPQLGKALEEYWVTTFHAPKGHTLDWWIRDEESGDERAATLGYLAGDQAAGAYFELKASIHWYGDDKEDIEKVLREMAADPKQLKALNDRLQQDKELTSDIKGVSGVEGKINEALLAGNVNKADALRLRQQIDEARKAGDDDKLHDSIAAVSGKELPGVRQEFAKLIKGDQLGQPLTDEQATDVLVQYATEDKEYYSGGRNATTRTARLSAESKALTVALATRGEGTPAARAARLAFEVNRGGKPRTEKLEKALVDPELAILRKKIKEGGLKPEEEAAIRGRLAVKEQERDALFTQFAQLRGADEATQKDPAKALAFAERSVRGMDFNDVGADYGAALVREARVNPALAIKYAVKGWGTNKELIVRTLKTMTPAEIEDLKVDYARRYGEGDHAADALFDDLGVFQNKATADAAGVKQATDGGFFTELSGDKRQEVEELLIGVPQNDRDRLHLARLKDEHQRGEGTTWVTRGLMSASDPGQALKQNRDRLESIVLASGGESKAFDEKGNFIGNGSGFTRNDFLVHAVGTGEAAENYKHRVDSIADGITGAIALIGAIVGTIVVEALSFGTATPAVIALWAGGIALATGAAAMAANWAIRGGRYGWEQAAVDGALTLVDAATAGLMAGAGAKAAKIAKEVRALQATARLASQGRTALTLAEKVAQRELVNGFARAAAGAAFGSAARTALDGNTWDEGVLSGLGHVVGSAAKGGLIGAATHGAAHSFNTSRFGERLQEGGWLARGFGHGLGGAIGNMGGRSAELGIDAATGESIGPWHEALGSIVGAGGRGFAENFGAGVAGRIAEDRQTARTRTQPGVEPTRVRTPGDEEHADQAFRQRAVEAAVRANPGLDQRKFLAQLDAGVAVDRGKLEEQRQAIRELRREALAAVPPAEREQYAGVPIHLVSDEEFERFTDSKKGRAVTVFVAGEARIIVRKSASPEVLREEGIHVMQARDPRFKARIERLDEKHLANWEQLDIETQLGLYQDKLVLEIDAQHKLRASLLEEAAGSDSSLQRARLLARARAAEHSLEQLMLRSVEVEHLGPERRAAIRDGKEAKPQYLREPPRLFNKEATLAEPEPEPEAPKPNRKLTHQDEDLATLPRRPVALENTTLDDPKLRGQGNRVYRIGDEWTEPETYRDDADGLVKTRDRTYRMVELVDAAGNVTARRGEILQLEGRFQQRGSETQTWGVVFEEASRLRTMERARALAGHDIDPNVDEVVPIGAMREAPKVGADATEQSNARPLSAQHSGGAGFDDVVFTFKTIGGKVVASFEIIEAKGYRRSLALGDFSAITTNMDTNLRELAGIVRSSNLSPERLEAAIEAIGARNFSVRIDKAPTAGLGELGTPGATIQRTIRDTEETRRQLIDVQSQLRTAVTQPMAEPMRAQLRQDARRVQQLRSELEAAYEAVPFNADHVKAKLREIAEGVPAVPAQPATATEPATAGRPKLTSLGEIVKQYGGTLPAASVKLTVEKLETEKGGADRHFLDAATKSNSRAAQDLKRSLGIAVGFAEQEGMVHNDFAPVPTTASDVQLLASPDGKRGLAVTSPPVTTPGTGSQSATSKALVALIHDGVPTATGSTRVTNVLWDAALARPADVGRVLKQVRAAMRDRPAELAQLKVMLPGAAASSEMALRWALALPRNAAVQSVVHPHEGKTWLISFPVAAPKP